MKLLIGSANKGKLIDIREGLKDLFDDFLLPTDLHISEIPEEEGDTFQENALLKAKFYHERGQCVPTLADDSGIIVEALNDQLGVHTRRWGAGAIASDEEWVDHFLKTMKRHENKRARFVCALCYIDETGRHHFFEGSCDGVITETIEAPYLPGLPIAGCFKPDGCEIVYSAMGIEGKNSWSHRGKAITNFRNYIISIKP